MDNRLDKNKKLIINGMFPNQDNTLITLATNYGYHIYECNNFRKVSLIDDFLEFLGSLKIAIPLYESQVLLLVGTQDNLILTENMLVLWDDLKKTKIGVITITEPILEVKLSKGLINIIVKDKCLIFSLKTLKHLYTLDDVNLLSSKLFSISFGSNPICYAYSSLTNNHQVKVAKFLIDESNEITSKLQMVITTDFDIVQYVGLSDDAEYLAVVSQFGNKVHLYSLLDYQLKMCLWRGVIDAIVLSISFCENNEFMAIVSNKYNLHIYDINEEIKNLNCNCKNISELSKFNQADLEDDDEEKDQSFFSNIFGQMQNVFQDRHKTSFAKYKYCVDQYNLTKSSFTHLFFDNKKSLVLIDSKGFVEKIKFNLNEGGDCWSVNNIKWLTNSNRNNNNEQQS